MNRLMVVVVVSLAFAGVARADDFRDSEWYFENENGAQLFRNRVSNLCLGVSGVDNHSPTARTEVYHCWPGGGDPGQDGRWTWDDLGNGYFHIKNRVSDLCLGVVGIDPGGAGATEVWHCSSPVSGDPGHDMQWYWLQRSSGYYQIRNRASGLCLSVYGIDSHSAGTGTETYTCSP